MSVIIVVLLVTEIKLLLFCFFTIIIFSTISIIIIIIIIITIITIIIFIIVIIVIIVSINIIIFVIPENAVVSKLRDRYRILHWSISYTKCNWTRASNVCSELCDVRIRQYRLRVEVVISTLLQIRVDDVGTYCLSVN